MNSGFRSNVPVLGGSDTDNSYVQHNRYRPGQYFWRCLVRIKVMMHAQVQQFPQITFVQPSHPELVQSGSGSLPAQSSSPAASPESAEVEDSGKASESSIMQEIARRIKNDKVTRLSFTLRYVTVDCL